jgi:predicted helicase
MSIIQTYLDTLANHLQAGNATEHTHRPALQNLLNALLPEYRVTNEPRRLDCGSPDFEIAKDNVPLGYVEAKDVGADLDKVQKSEQLMRYFRSLDNVILTDYLEFRWILNQHYHAELTVKLAEVDKKGNLTVLPDALPRLENLLENFRQAQVITLRSPEDLAEKMAYIAEQIKESMLQGYQNETQTGRLHGQLDSFRSVLIDTLTVAEFSDMVAQTVCYGLFAAKCSSVGQPFSRLTAIYFVPKTNPFLRQLFSQLAGVDLDEGLVWLVEHLVKVLNHADIAAILADFGKRTRQEDPVVHFYETFLAHYNPKLREIRGVYYTPEPVVSYIVRSVDLLLKDKFKLKKGLADSTQLENGQHKVQILDPATGTGTFLYAVIANIYEEFKKNKGSWSTYVTEHLLPRVHGFELLMAAYTVAHMKLGLQLQEYGYDFKTDERLRVFLTNTLDKAHDIHEPAFAKWLSDEANAANAVKKDTPVMVILGNPPYSGHSANTGEWINELLRGTDISEAEQISHSKKAVQNTANYFQLDGESLNERNPKWLNDDYVKFIRFAQWRIHKTGHGILGFVTNHGYLDNPTFRGMRQALMQEFDEIYLLDLHGNSKKKEKSPDGSTDKNVFDIQQGVAIGIFVKHQLQQNPSGFKNLKGLAKVYHAHLYGERKTKYQWLEEKDIKNTQWTELKPQAPFYLFSPQNINLLSEYEQNWIMKQAMPVSSMGTVTSRDHFAIDFDKKIIKQRITDMLNNDLDDFKFSLKYSLKNNRDWQLDKARKQLKTQNNWVQKIIAYSYRPFDRRYCYFNGAVMDYPRRELEKHVFGKDNLCLGLGRQGIAVNDSIWGLITVSANPMDANVFRRGGVNIFPLYIYPTTKNDLISDTEQQDTTRKANFSLDFIIQLETCLNLQFIIEGKGDFEETISALDIFHYMYAVFHSPTYRMRYAEFLKIDFPRLPLTSDKNLFKQLADLGEQLVQIHLMNVDIENDCCFNIAGDCFVEKVEYKDHKVYINKTQYFDNVTPEIWEFHIGGYQVCQKWLKDRKDRQLTYNDINHYLSILAALEKTQQLMTEIDKSFTAFLA